MGKRIIVRSGEIEENAEIVESVSSHDGDSQLRVRLEDGREQVVSSDDVVELLTEG